MPYKLNLQLKYRAYMSLNYSFILNVTASLCANHLKTFKFKPDYIRE